MNRPLSVFGNIVSTGLVMAAAAAAAAATFAPELSPGPASFDAGDAARVRYVIATDGTEARYRVREQLAGFDFPSDAVGRTTSVQGGITIEDDGTIVRDASRFTIDATQLATDSDRRDNFIRRRTLETAEYPTIAFAPTEFRGLTFPLPGSGESSFELVGDLTIRNVTRPTTWQVTARFEESGIRGTARTEFTFEEFRMSKPRVGRVLSVADSIRLELDFHLVPEPGR